ncbi:MAG TPA: hypothetical protein VG711_06020, partial [Phycisphaerales bacterium]|nr:hypothetical protein [Phycisphaerales bacterium]
SDLSSVAAFKSYFEEEEKLHQEIVDLDFDFIGKMESILADVQKEKMWRVAADRQRREAKYKYIGLRSIVIDFSEVVQDDLGLTEDELSRVDPVLAEYERETTPLRIKIGQSIRNIRDKEYELLVATVVAPDGHILDAKNESDLELSRAAQRNREGLLTHHAELQLPLEKIQDVYASKIAEALSSVKAKEFTSRYRAIAWPAVYPDMSDPEGLYEAMMADENLAADIRTALKSQWEIYRENYEHICNGMRKCQSQHMFIFASTTRQSDMAQYAQAMIEFRTKRYEVNLKIVKDMKYLIPQDILKWQRGCEAVEKNIHAIMDASDEGIPYPST